MNLTDAFAESPGSACEAVIDPLLLGYNVVGLPPWWRRTRTDVIDGAPGASWIDSSVLQSRSAGIETELIFASVAILMAWRLNGLGRTPIEVAALFCGMTEDVSGWECRSTENGALDAASASIRLFGTLDSPYGPLISNSHSIVYLSGTDELVAIQLSVTATPDGESCPDRIALRIAR